MLELHGNVSKVERMLGGDVGYAVEQLMKGDRESVSLVPLSPSVPSDAHFLKASCVPDPETRIPKLCLFYL